MAYFLHDVEGPAGLESSLRRGRTSGGQLSSRRHGRQELITNCKALQHLGCAQEAAVQTLGATIKQEIEGMALDSTGLVCLSSSTPCYPCRAGSSPGDSGSWVLAHRISPGPYSAGTWQVLVILRHMGAIMSCSSDQVGSFGKGTSEGSIASWAAWASGCRGA